MGIWSRVAVILENFLVYFVLNYRGDKIGDHDFCTRLYLVDGNWWLMDGIRFSNVEWVWGCPLFI